MEKTGFVRTILCCVGVFIFAIILHNNSAKALIHPPHLMISKKIVSIVPSPQEERLETIRGAQLMAPIAKNAIFRGRRFSAEVVLNQIEGNFRDLRLQLPGEVVTLRYLLTMCNILYHSRAEYEMLRTENFEKASNKSALINRYSAAFMRWKEEHPHRLEGADVPMEPVWHGFHAINCCFQNSCFQGEVKAAKISLEAMESLYATAIKMVAKKELPPFVQIAKE